MDRLKQISENHLHHTQTSFVRFLMDRIDWDQRMIGISGARGTGKTTMLLQYIKTRLTDPTEALYVSLDDIYFAENHLVHFAEEFYKKGGDYLVLDEVHKYPDWSRELKNIYDNLPGLKIIFTSSSALDVYKGTFDLSRRALIYKLPGLSFREFIELKYKIKLQSYTIENIMENAGKSVPGILKTIKPLKLFDEYLRFGYYPFFIESEKNYSERLLSILNLVLESDLPPIYNIDYYALMKIKKMLAVISRIVPFQPNIEKLAVQTSCTRDTLLKYLFYLEKADILKWLSKDTYGINYLNKPDKLYLNNTNLMYALSSEKPDKGNLRETFLLNQLMVHHNISYPERGDFLVDEKYIIEVGGASKKSKQIKGIENAFIAVDDIEFPDGNKIPLWLFGFLY